MDKIKIPIEFDVDKASKDAAKKAEAAFGKGVKIDVTADTSQAEKNISKVESDIKGISDKKVNVDADNSRALKSIDKIKSELKGISDKKINLDVDTSGAESGIGGILEQFGGLGDKLGDFGGGLGSAIGKFGELGKAAGVAGAAIAAAFAAFEVGSVLDGINTQIEQVRILGKVSKGEASSIQAQVKAIASVYDKDYNEVLQTAKSVTKQFGIPLQETIDLMQSGFLAGADASDEFLDILKEYPAAMVQSGISAKDFIELTALQAREGVFSDKGIDAIKETGISLREQTKATQAAMEQAFGKEQSAKWISGIKSGALSTLDVLEGMAPKLKSLDKTARETVIADVFRSAGEDSLLFLQQIGSADAELEKMIENRGKLAEREAGQLEMQKSFNEAINNLAQKLEPVIDFFVDLGVSIATFGADAISFLVDIVEYASPLITLGKALYKSIEFLVNIISDAVSAGAKWIDETLGLSTAFEKVKAVIDDVIGFVGDLYSTVDGFFVSIGLSEDNTAEKVKEVTNEIIKSNQIIIEEIKKQTSFADLANEWTNKFLEGFKKGGEEGKKAAKKHGADLANEWTNKFLEGFKKGGEEGKKAAKKHGAAIKSSYDSARNSVNEYIASINKANETVRKISKEEAEIQGLEKQSEKLIADLKKQLDAKTLTEEQYKSLVLEINKNTEKAIFDIKYKYLNEYIQAEADANKKSLAQHYVDEEGKLQKSQETAQQMVDVRLNSEKEMLAEIAEMEEKNLTEMAEKYSIFFGFVTDAQDGLTDLFKSNAEERTKINYNELQTEIKDLGMALAKQEISLEEYQSREQDIRQTYQDKQKAANESMAESANKLAEAFENAADKYSESIKTFAEKYAEQSFMIMEVNNGLLGENQNFLEAMVENWSNAGALIGTTMGSIGAMLGKSLAEDTLTLKGFLSDAGIAILNTLQQLVNAMGAAALLKNVGLFGLGTAGTIGFIVAANIAIAAAKGALQGAEKGRIPGITKAGKKGATDTELMWTNPNEAILTEKQSKENRNFLEHIAHGGSETDYTPFKEIYEVESVNYKLDTTMSEMIATNRALAKAINSGIKVESYTNLNIQKESGIKVSKTNLCLR